MLTMGKYLFKFSENFHSDFEQVYAHRVVYKTNLFKVNFYYFWTNNFHKK